MAGTNYPGSLDDGTSLPNPGASDSTQNTNANLNHNYQHDTENDAIKALETKLGTGSSTPATTGHVLRYNGSQTVWAQLSYNDLSNTPNVSGTNTGDQTLSVVGSTLTISGTNGNSVTLPSGGGGTASSPLTTKGDIWVYGAADTRLAVGTNTFVLTADSSTATGLKWAAASGGGTWGSITGTLSSQTDLQTALDAKAAKGANSDITSLSGLTTALSVAQGGTGLKTLTSGNFLTASGTTTVATSKVAPAGAVVGTSDTQTLTSKTLDNTNTISLLDTNFTLQDDGDATKQVKFNVSGMTTGTTKTFNLPGITPSSDTIVTLAPAQTITGVKTFSTAPVISTITNTGTITLPTATDTLVGRATTDTLTNKTLTGGLVTADPSAALGIASKQYVDALGSTSLIRNETPGGLINGSNTAYTTASTFATGSLKVYLNGQRLAPGSGIDYVEGTQSFTMQYAPATGDVLLVDYETTNTAFIQGSNSIIVQETPTGTVNGTTTLFTVLQGKYVANTLEVFINGLQQTKTTDYTETSPGSGTFTFTTAPLTGDVVKVSYQFSTGASGNADTVDGFHASSTATANTLVPLDSNARFDQTTLPLGAVVQVVTTNYSAAVTGTTQIPLDGTIPQSTEGDQYMSQTITPKSSTNLLVIEAYALLSNTGSANSMAVALFQDSGASAIAVSSNNLQGGTAGVPIPLKFSMTAGTTSATTFKIRAGYSTTGTTSFNATSGVANTYGTVPKSYIQITEYKA